jgi:hypothetical protein
MVLLCRIAARLIHLFCSNVCVQENTCISTPISLLYYVRVVWKHATVATQWLTTGPSRCTHQFPHRYELPFDGGTPTFAHTAFEHVAEDVLKVGSEKGFRHGAAPVLIIVISDGRTLFPQSNPNAFEESLQADELNGGNVNRMVFTIAGFPTDEGMYGACFGAKVVFCWFLAVGFDSYGRVLLDKNALSAGQDIPCAVIGCAWIPWRLA